LAVAEQLALPPMVLPPMLLDVPDVTVRNLESVRYKSASWKNIVSVIDVDPQNSHEFCCFNLEFPTSAKKCAGFTQNSPR